MSQFMKTFCVAILSASVLVASFANAGLPASGQKVQTNSGHQYKAGDLRKENRHASRKAVKTEYVRTRPVGPIYKRPVVIPRHRQVKNIVVVRTYGSHLLGLWPLSLR